MTQPIWYDTTEAGAPTLNDAAGSLLEVLRACLINGFGAKTVTSIAVASEVATATCAAHGFLGTYGKLVLISGATEPLLNGNKQPGGVLTNSFTFPAPGVADGTYTGTMIAKRAPLGWTEPHTGTDVAIFARSAPEATAMMLRVDDSGSGSMARVRGVEAATGIDAFSGPFPTDAQVSGGGYWEKGHANTTTAKHWVVCGNDRAFYLAVQLSVAGQFVVYFFGDPTPYYGPDAYFALLSDQSNTSPSSNPSWGLSISSNYASAPSIGTRMYAPRGVLPGENTAEFHALCGPNCNSILGYSDLQSAVTYSSAIVTPVLHVVAGAKCVRGEMPGMAAPLAAVPFASGVPIDASGQKFLPLTTNTSGSLGQILLRLSGVWHP